MTVIARLGTLIDDAVQRGDARASDALRDALELIVTDAANDRALKGRRSSDADRQRRKRGRDSRDVTLRHATPRDGSQGFPPTPPFPNSPKRVEDDTARAEVDPMLEINRGLLQQRMGDLYPDAESFAQRRPAVTWAAWYGEMLTCLTGLAEPADIAQVCRDDAALARPVGSPRGFRIFVANTVRDRLEASRPGVGGRPGLGQRAFETTLTAIEDL